MDGLSGPNWNPETSISLQSCETSISLAVGGCKDNILESSVLILDSLPTGILLIIFIISECNFEKIEEARSSTGIHPRGVDKCAPENSAVLNVLHFQVFKVAQKCLRSILRSRPDGPQARPSVL